MQSTVLQRYQVLQLLPFFLFSFYSFYLLGSDHNLYLQELDQCIGCMQVTANMKLNKLCDNVTESRNSDSCTMCYCRPMWCIECMAKWSVSFIIATFPILHLC